MISVAAAGALFRKPASVITTGDELTAITWVFASFYGPGTRAYYPMEFIIHENDGCLSAVITGSVTVPQPGIRLSEGTPMPSSFSQSGDSVSLEFREVPW